jgi:hypothetical protein
MENSGQYMHHLPDYAEFEKAFNEAGYNIEVDLSNSLIIEKKSDVGMWVEYDDLPEHLQNLIGKFAEDNDLN